MYFGPVRWHKPLVGKVLGLCGRGVLEALQGFADSVGHGDGNVIAGVVPFHCQAAVLATRSFDGY